MRKVESEYEGVTGSRSWKQSLTTSVNGVIWALSRNRIYIEDTLDMHFRIITIPGDRAGDSPRTAAYWTDLMEFLYHGV